MSIGKIRPQILNMPTEKKVEPFSVDFAYTGTVQEYVVPTTGLYKLEVWGGRGGNNGGLGGYSVGYKKINKNTKLYIVNGGTGGSCSKPDSYTQATGCGGGYNGGGQGTAQDYSGCGDTTGGGGGATHIALVTGLLKDIGKETFVTNSKGLIVAGGGGGRASYGGGSGGSGGGLSGERGRNSDSYYSCGGGGTQTSGANFGAGSGTARYGTYSDPVPSSGGGGGFYGGTGGFYGSAGGGSGWIDGVPALTYKGTTYNPSTSNGVNSGTGKAKISYIA